MPTIEDVVSSTDQGSQFTGEAFTGKLEERGIQISMDGRRRARHKPVTGRPFL